MTDDEDAIREGLRDVLRTKGDSAKLQLAKASAGRTLARLHGDTPEPPRSRPPANVAEEMAAIVTGFCPNYPAVLSDPLQDPIRDLDGAEQLRLAGKRRVLAPIVWTWLPTCPDDVDRAERTILEAMHRLGVERGPFELLGEGYSAGA